MKATVDNATILWILGTAVTVLLAVLTGVIKSLSELRKDVEHIKAVRSAAEDARAEKLITALFQALGRGKKDRDIQ